MSKKKLVIIGNGMGTCRLLDELTTRGSAFQYEITVFGEEQGGAYNRIMLGKVLAGGSPDDIVTKPLEWYDKNNVRLIDRTRVVKLDTLRKQVITADGQSRASRCGNDKIQCRRSGESDACGRAKIRDLRDRTGDRVCSVRRVDNDAFRSDADRDLSAPRRHGLRSH